MSFPKTKVHILLSGAYERNEYAFIAPIQYNRKLLRVLGIQVRFFFEAEPALYDCDTLVISSKYARHQKLWAEPSRVAEFLGSCKKANKLIWADLSDGTGTGQFAVLDRVDRYIKSSLLKDRSLYGQPYYGGRVFTHFYHEKFGVEDERPAEAHLNLPLEKTAHFDKLELGWNQFMLDYSYYGAFGEKVFRKMKWLPRNIAPMQFKPAGRQREILLNSRFSTNYNRNTVAFQRKQIQKLLKGKSPTDRISPKKYYAELANSRFVLSPFGWGEVCYRDFEAIRYGAVLVKPDCSHLDTWPNFYQNGYNYLAFPWSLEGFESFIEELGAQPDKYIELSRNAQQLYKKVLFDEEGKQSFAKRFAALVIFNQTTRTGGLES